MSATKSNYSWDFEVKKFNGKLFIDKRHRDPENKEEQPNILDYLTVDETALENQPLDDETLNGIWPLMREAKSINDSFLNACQNKDVTKIVTLDNENPFLEDENQVATRIGYHYNIWRIQEADEELGLPEKKICIRCSVHCHTGIDRGEGEGKQTMNVYAINEYDPNLTDWRNTIDTAIVPCLSKQLTNNNFKITRWLLQALLAQVDFIKFAFVNRKQVNDNTKH